MNIDKKVTLSIPMKMSLDKAKSFVRKKANWIKIIFRKVYRKWLKQHELSHFKYQNHSKNFYNFITIFMTDWKERKKILDEEFMGVV